MFNLLWVWPSSVWNNQENKSGLLSIDCGNKDWKYWGAGVVIMFFLNIVKSRYWITKYGFHSIRVNLNSKKLIQISRAYLRVIIWNLTIAWALGHCFYLCFFILNVCFRNCGFDIVWWTANVHHSWFLSSFYKRSKSFKFHSAFDDWFEISHFIVVTYYKSCDQPN